MGGGKDAYLRRLERFAELIEQKAASLDPAIKGEIVAHEYPWQVKPETAATATRPGVVERAREWATGLFAGDSGTATEGLSGPAVPPAPPPPEQARSFTSPDPGTPRAGAAGLPGLAVPEIGAAGEPAAVFESMSLAELDGLNLLDMNIAALDALEAAYKRKKQEALAGDYAAQGVR